LKNFNVRSTNLLCKVKCSVQWYFEGMKGKEERVSPATIHPPKYATNPKCITPTPPIDPQTPARTLSNKPKDTLLNSTGFSQNARLGSVAVTGVGLANPTCKNKSSPFRLGVSLGCHNGLFIQTSCPTAPLTNFGPGVCISGVSRLFEPRRACWL